MKKLLLIIALFLFLNSCDDNNTNTKKNNDTQYLFFATHLNGVNKIYKISLIDGKKEVFLDSAETYCLPVNGKLVFMKQEFRPAPDSGFVEEQYLYQVNLDGSGKEKILDKDFGSTSIHLVISPKGDKIAYRKDGFLYLINIEEKSLAQIAEASITNYHYYFSNDGKKLAYLTNDFGIYVYDIVASSITNIFKKNPNLGGFGNGFTWSYDDTELILPLSIYDSSKLVAINIQNFSIRDIIADNSVQFPAVYNSGKRILFTDMQSTSTKNYIFDIYTCNNDGTDIQKVTPNEGNGYQYLYWQPFISEFEIVGFRAIPDGNGRCDALAIINVKTKKIRIVSENFFLE